MGPFGVVPGLASLVEKARPEQVRHRGDELAHDLFANQA